MTKLIEIPVKGQLWTWNGGNGVVRYDILKVRKHWWYGVQCQIYHEQDDWITTTYLLRNYTFVSNPTTYRYLNRCSSNTPHAQDVEVVTLMHSIKEVAPSVLAVVTVSGAIGVLILRLVNMSKLLMQ